MADPSPPSSSSFAGKQSRRVNSEISERLIFAAVQGKSCPVCLENLADRRVAVITACKHAYCSGCIRRWSSVKRNCPLCNSHFDSWLYVIDLGSGKFLKEELPPLSERKTVNFRRRRSSGGHRRLIQISRQGFDNSGSRSRPLPWRRSFGRPGSVPDHVIHERKLQWRASIYERNLRATLASTRKSFEQRIRWNDQTKAMILQKIEPWIRRELQVVLRDPDPSIVVHVASSLFIESLERKHDQYSGQTGMPVDELSSLRKFLHDKVEIFWHELGCFAESTLNLETYDTVVEYIRIDGTQESAASDECIF
ncbi:PREDICTED: E3 ubiquitin-protein ligase Topors [Tarenaya hassleriana]|uniref:E3 ubiquitin-protein ligase Topors n=1 Tax=Tarenaya hassleriana TaxID=28532 RepID=UPI00053C3A91|nr:PREDICTED: E3 ubiquitin-protein ligase Topors [Tarenaya hassleriana]